MDSVDLLSDNDDCLADEDFSIIFNYFSEHGTENQLSFNGNVEMAKAYSEKETLDFLMPIENHMEDSTDECQDESKADLSLMNLHNESSKAKPLFQIDREPRAHFLLRSPKLWQEFLNSGNLAMLKKLLIDILTEDCLFQLHAKASIVGVDKIFELQCSNLDNLPDYYVLFSNIKRVKRRLWTLKSNAFGTLLPANGNDNLSHIWNIFEHTPVGSLDEHHKLQKQKYDYLKSQNKMIKLERRSFYCLVLNRKMTKFQKVMASESILDVFE